MNIGKKGKSWIQARARLKREFFNKGIIACEICESTYCLSFHHRNKRRNNDEHSFDNVILLCAKHHNELEYNRELTNEWFSKLRDKSHDQDIKNDKNKNV